MGNRRTKVIVVNRHNKYLRFYNIIFEISFYSLFNGIIFKGYPISIQKKFIEDVLRILTNTSFYLFLLYAILSINYIKL